MSDEGDIDIQRSGGRPKREQVEILELAASPVTVLEMQLAELQAWIRDLSEQAEQVGHEMKRLKRTEQRRQE